MNQVAWTRAAVLYMPLLAAAVAAALTPRRPRKFAALLLSSLWAATTLLVLQRFNLMEGWWTFPSAGASLCGMPLELYLGWVILWGLVPQIAFSSTGIAWQSAIFALVDLYLMPLCKVIVHLEPTWLFGEAVAIAFVLLPALCVARWTESGTRLKARAALQTVTAGLLFLFLVPEVVFALRAGGGWAPLLQLPGWQLQIGIQLMLLLALPGVAAVMEFATRGDGTPIPYDPPKRLVTSGIYRYVANPMQVSCTLVMFCWAGILQNGWLLLAAAMAAIYSAGIADWDERRDLKLRFGDPWQEYRTQVRNWLPRWRPFHAGEPAKIYIAASCGPCTELRRWLEARKPAGLEILDAETLPPGTIRRIRYEPCDGSRSVEGVRALGRVLEHIHLFWAIAGAALRIPLIWQGIQILMDASGLGPRNVVAHTCTAQGKIRTEGGMPQSKPLCYYLPQPRTTDEISRRSIMADQAWFTADGSGGDGLVAAPPPPVIPAQSRYELRPLTTGELLDRTFYLYRSNFWLFVGLASIAAGVNTVAALAQVVYMHAMGMTQPTIFGGGAAGHADGANGVMQNLVVSLIAMFSSLIYLAVYSVTQAATTSAVTALYLGETTSMGKALNAVKGRWFRFILIGLWQIWSATWALVASVIVGSLVAGGLVVAGGASSSLAVGLVLGVVMLAGAVYGVIAYIRNSFAVPASVMEDLKVRKAMRRSKNLTSGSKGRIFLLFLFVIALYMVAIAIGTPLSILVMQNKTAHIFLLQSLNIIIGLITGSVVGPVGAIGLCLFYIDQRIRKEGFDIEFLMERSGPAPVVAAFSAPSESLEGSGAQATEAPERL